MLHKRIISAVITQMDELRAGYFGRVVDRLEQDPRTERYPNLPVLVLKETIEDLPTYLDPPIVVNHLFQFLQANKDDLTRTIHSAAYIADNTVLAPHCAPFVEAVIRETLATVDGNEQDREGRSEYRVGWPYDPDAFPYIDDEAEDEDL